MRHNLKNGKSLLSELLQKTITELMRVNSLFEPVFTGGQLHYKRKRPQWLKDFSKAVGYAKKGESVGLEKKLSDIDTFDELIVDVLARNGLPLQKEVALQYLCDEGYLARRNYSGIEQLLIKAKELRNQKGL